MESTPHLIDGLPVVPTTSAREILADARPELVAAVREVAETGTAMLSQVARRHRLTTPERDLLGWLAEQWPTVVVRPAAPAAVKVTFPGGEWRDAHVVTGRVLASDGDSLLIVDDDDGQDFTLFDRQQIEGSAQVEVRLP